MTKGAKKGKSKYRKLKEQKTAKSDECNLFACILSHSVAQGFSPASKWQS